ncbi:hypothetical protein C0J52_06271, partial [Blattella germanica]
RNSDVKVAISYNQWRKSVISSIVILAGSIANIPFFYGDCDALALQLQSSLVHARSTDSCNYLCIVCSVDPSVNKLNGENHISISLYMNVQEILTSAPFNVANIDLDLLASVLTRYPYDTVAHSEISTDGWLSTLPYTLLNFSRIHMVAHHLQKGFRLRTEETVKIQDTQMLKRPSVTLNGENLLFPAFAVILAGSIAIITFFSARSTDCCVESTSQRNPPDGLRTEELVKIRLVVEKLLEAGKVLNGKLYLCNPYNRRKLSLRHFTLFTTDVVTSWVEIAAREIGNLKKQQQIVHYLNYLCIVCSVDPSVNKLNGENHISISLYMNVQEILTSAPFNVANIDLDLLASVLTRYPYDTVAHSEISTDGWLSTLPYTLLNFSRIHMVAHHLQKGFRLRTEETVKIQDTQMLKRPSVTLNGENLLFPAFAVILAGSIAIITFFSARSTDCCVESTSQRNPPDGLRTEELVKIRLVVEKLLEAGKVLNGKLYLCNPYNRRKLSLRHFTLFTTDVVTSWVEVMVAYDQYSAVYIFSGYLRLFSIPWIAPEYLVLENDNCGRI